MKTHSIFLKTLFTFFLVITTSGYSLAENPRTTYIKRLLNDVDAVPVNRADQVKQGEILSEGKSLPKDYWNKLENSRARDVEINTQSFPDRLLPRNEHGVPVPDSNAPHTQLGVKSGRLGKYPQAREFGTDGELVRDIDFTNHGRSDHKNPHQHRYLRNESGGSNKRGSAEPLSEK